jgi:hypothetical protein
VPWRESYFLWKSRKIEPEGYRSEWVHGASCRRNYNQSGNYREHQASDEMTARRVKFIDRKESNGRVPVDGPQLEECGNDELNTP